MEDSGLGGADGQHDHKAELELLKGRIMVDIEAKLSQKEESLWRRGQVEIRRLQIEQQQVSHLIGEMQEQQAALNTENQEIKGVLLEVTSKFERVVNEMREVLRALPQRSGGDRPSPSPSVASTSASEAAGDDRSFEHPSEQNSSILTATEPSGLWSVDRGRRQVQTPVTPTPVPMWHTRGPGEGLAELPSFDPEDLVAGAADSRTFWTPPRTSPSHEDAAWQADAAAAAPPPPASWHLPAVASPAPAVLSLASALPSVSQAAAAPSPGFKRLHLAEHIEQAAATPPNATGQSDCSSAAVAGGPAPTAAAKQPELISLELAKEPGFVTLGMEVKQVDGLSLRIERIDEHGLVGRYNARQDAEASRVQAGDHIVEANGLRRDPQGMLQECKARQRLLLTLLRGAEGGLGAGRAGGGEREGAGLADAGEEPAPRAAHAEAAPAAAAEISKLGSPSSTRLRPEAGVFVPSGQKGASPAPPGLEAYEAAVQGVEPAALGEARGQVSLADQEEVKRALFP